MTKTPETGDLMWYVRTMEDDIETDYGPFKTAEDALEWGSIFFPDDPVIEK